MVIRNNLINPNRLLTLKDLKQPFLYGKKIRRRDREILLVNDEFQKGIVPIGILKNINLVENKLFNKIELNNYKELYSGSNQIIDVIHLSLNMQGISDQKLRVKKMKVLIIN